MKKFSRLVFAAFGLAILLYLTACDSETVAPKKNAQHTLSRDNNLSIPLHWYLLHKRGEEVIEYDAYNRLKKVTYSGNYYVQYNWHTINGQRYLTAKSFSGSNLIKKVDYRLTSEGKCISSTMQYYSSSSPVYTKSLVYNYNGNGKLWWFYNPDAPQERTFITYNSAGDVIKIVENKASGKMVKTIEFSYTKQLPKR